MLTYMLQLYTGASAFSKKTKARDSKGLQSCLKHEFIMIQQYSSIMASNDLHQTYEGGHNNNRLYFKIPRVLPHQREKFETEELFRQNSQKSEVNNCSKFRNY